MDDLTIKIGGVQLGGWMGVNLVRGIERMPSSFSISTTERWPGDSGRFILKPGDPLQVMIGSDVVLTGYADRFSPSLSASQHAVTLTGRGKCQDLVDCSHAWKSCQMSNVTVLDIAKNLAEPYGVSVNALADVGAPIPQVNLSWGDDPYSVIEMHARYRTLLTYEGADGSLILAQAAKPDPKAVYPSIQEGVNIESAVMQFGMDQRYSEYVLRRLSMDVFSDVGEGGDTICTCTDPEVPRFRRLSLIAESGDSEGYPVSQARAEWEAARRAGRSNQLSATVDSWWTSAGDLWEPNMLVRVKAPTLRLPDVVWLVSQVTYRRDMTGTHADLVLMPPEAFSPRPIILFPAWADIVGGGA